MFPVGEVMDLAMGDSRMAESQMVIRGGDKLEAKLKEIARNVTRPATLQVGFLGGANYPDKNATPVAMVAAFSEYGVPAHNQPPRPFFRNMIDREKANWPDQIVSILKRLDYDAQTTLAAFGQIVAGQLRESITTGPYAPLSPITIARKGFDTPLIDTAFMLQSIDSKVIGD